MWNVKRVACNDNPTEGCYPTLQLFWAFLTSLAHYFDLMAPNSLQGPVSLLSTLFTKAAVGTVTLSTACRPLLEVKCIPWLYTESVKKYC